MYNHLIIYYLIFFFRPKSGCHTDLNVMVVFISYTNTFSLEFNMVVQKNFELI